MVDKYHRKFLGNKCKDVHTGFTGIADSITYFLNGCIRVSIQPPVDKDGKFQKSCWFDVEQVEVVEEENIQPGKRSGGPASAEIPSDMKR